ncbi:hypothetical protein [Salinibaculum rarum]|uniref:hypothetical protein n=1 Tax=Salinibaculum rarum TaxID=3058903 RepID=UPI00265FB308|nr:hypothetical protein [Salinibaculum sp. KK48]
MPAQYTPADTEPDAQPCTLCEMDPTRDDTTVVETANRGLLSVDKKLDIEPICSEHIDQNHADAVQEAYNYGGESFVQRCINAGVFTATDAADVLPNFDPTS